MGPSLANSMFPSQFALELAAEEGGSAASSVAPAGAAAVGAGTQATLTACPGLGAGCGVSSPRALELPTVTSHRGSLGGCPSPPGKHAGLPVSFTNKCFLPEALAYTPTRRGQWGSPQVPFTELHSSSPFCHPRSSSLLWNPVSTVSRNEVLNEASIFLSVLDGQ